MHKSDPAKGHDFSPRQAAQRMMGTRTNSRMAQKRTLFIPKQGHASRYSPEWEPYIAANVHLYASPLAIFLRRARELDFSSSKHMRSLKVIDRVFRVFTPPVVDAVSRHLSGVSTFSYLVQRHRELLGPYAPSEGAQSLSSCQADMKGLLEEMHIQHVKKVREMDILERIEAYVEGLFNFGIVSGEERALLKVVERAKAIVQLPLTYSPLAPPPTTPASSQAREHNLIEGGVLTAEGIQQVYTGATKIDPSMVKFLGDKADTRPQTHEIGIFVELASIASDYVFKKTGFRANFRVFADYRNILLIFLPVFLWRMLRSIQW